MALARRNSWPKLKVCDCCAGNPGNSCIPATTRTGIPLGSVSSTATPPMASGSVWIFCPVAPARRSTSARSSAANAVPTNRERGPRRTITHGEPASVPRSCSSSAVCSTVLKPNARAKASARTRSGFSNSSHARSRTLISGISGSSGVLSAQGALLAVQVFVGVDGCGHGVSFA